jgi:hypothetical protein
MGYYCILKHGPYREDGTTDKQPTVIGSYSTEFEAYAKATALHAEETRLSYSVYFISQADLDNGLYAMWNWEII